VVAVAAVASIFPGTAPERVSSDNRVNVAAGGSRVEDGVRALYGERGAVYREGITIEGHSERC